MAQHNPYADVLATTAEFLTINTTDNCSSVTTGQPNTGSPLSPALYLIVCIVAALCSAVTVCGNLLVILSFIVNRTMRNFSNYLILNLAISDIIIGLFSMNMFTVYNVNDNVWILGEGMCLTWLTVDYVASNTSVMNLLVICIDRYMAISNPVKYRQKTKAHVAVIVMISVWVISFIIWGPAILLWSVISPDDRIHENECYIPFMYNNPSVTIITAIAAFYAPSTAMCVLYWRVIVKIRRRGSNVAKLVTQATEVMTKKYHGSWKRNSSRKNKTEGQMDQSSGHDLDGDKKLQKTSNNATNSVEKEPVAIRKKNVSQSSSYNTMINARQRLTDVYNNLSSRRKSSKSRTSTLSSSALINKQGSGECSSNTTSDKRNLAAHIDSSNDADSTISHSSAEFSSSQRTHGKSSMINNNSLKDRLKSLNNSVYNKSDVEKHMTNGEVDELSGLSNDANKISCEKKTEQTKDETGFDTPTAIRLLASAQKGGNILHTTTTVSRRIKREKRATRLLKGILICFIALWLPYNLFVIISSVCPGGDCISSMAWNLGYWLCYLNSTVNPFCYGFCNDNFKRTFKSLLTTKWWTTAGRRKLRNQVRCTKSTKKSAKFAPQPELERKKTWRNNDQSKI